MYNGKIGLYLLEQIDIARELIAEKEFDSAIDYLKDAFCSIKGEEDIYSEEFVRICKLLGLCYRKKNMSIEGIKILKTAEVLCKRIYLKTNDIYWRKELAVCYVNEAIIYDAQGDFNKAIIIYENAIEIFHKLGDDESRLKAMLSLGVVYSKVNKSENTKLIYQEALDIIDSDYTLEGYRMLFSKMYEDIINEEERN